MTELWEETMEMNTKQEMWEEVAETSTEIGMREEGEEEDVMDMGTITIEEEEEEGLLIAEAAMNTSPATSHTKQDWAFVVGVTG